MTHEITKHGFHLVPHELEVYRRLSDLPSRAQLAFAIGCAEQLYPAYASLCRKLGVTDARELRDFIDRLWLHVSGERLLGDNDLSLIQQRLESMPTGDLDDYSIPRIAAEHALSAVWRAAAACRGDSAVEATKAAGLLDDVPFQEASDEQWGDFRGVAEPEHVDRVVKATDEDPRLKGAWAWEDRALDLLRARPDLPPDVLSFLRTPDAV